MRELPGVLESVVAFPAALRAWPVPGGERDGFVEEEQLGISIWRRHDPVPIPEFKNARYPAPALVAAHDSPVGVVESAATVSHHRAASCGSYEVAEGIDAVLPEHSRLFEYRRRRSSIDATRLFHEILDARSRDNARFCGDP